MLGRPREYAIAVSALLLVTLAGWFSPLNYRALGNIYLLVVIAVSLRVKPAPAFVTALLSGLAWNYVFMPPKRMSFSILKIEDSLLLVTYLIAALIASQLASLRTAKYRAEVLSESDRLHRTLLSSLAHDLKTPLAILRSAGEQVDTGDPVKRRHVTGEIGAAVRRLDSLVTNLLNQSRLEAGTLRANMDWCDAHDIVWSARRSVGERLEEHPLHVHIPPEVPLFFADAFLMEQVIVNLLLNAAVHTPADSAIRVSAGSVPSANSDPGRVFIKVTDDGPGISAEMQDRLFERFQRAGSSHPEGLGLGLTIVRGFMQAQGGEVVVESKAGQGATFTVFLPAVECDDLPTP